jgi:hypothetical protein
VIILYQVQNLTEKVFLPKKHKILSGEKSKGTMLKKTNCNYREIILEIENDAMIYRLLNPGWDKEDLTVKRKKKKSYK